MIVTIDDNNGDCDNDGDQWYDHRNDNDGGDCCYDGGWW